MFVTFSLCHSELDMVTQKYYTDVACKVLDLSVQYTTTALGDCVFNSKGSLLEDPTPNDNTNDDFTYSSGSAAATTRQPYYFKSFCSTSQLKVPMTGSFLSAT